MIVSVANNIISPLGMSTTENYAAVKAGQSVLRRYEGKWDLPEPFVASLVDRDKVEQAFAALADNAKYTFFEKMIILSASRAIQEAGIDTASERVLFILSTTKGNVFLLDKRETGFSEERVLLGSAARQMTDFFHNPNPPIVVSNACISGVCAQIEAMRNLESGCFDYVVTVGCDVQSAFIVSGFQSFKALSPEPCKPFDANHISGPSRTGEGSFRALKVALGDVDPNEIAFINAHGTATMYNDEMESVAIERAGLSQVPVNGLKGYYGHTMGAAGILESIVSMLACDKGVVLPTRGFSELGVSRPVRVSAQEMPTQGSEFIKLLSGFGGVNGALLFRKGGAQ